MPRKRNTPFDSSMNCPTELIAELPPSLQHGVRVYWQDWLASCDGVGVSSEVNIPLSLLGRQWACSEFVARACIRRPAMLHRLVGEGFESARTLADYHRLLSRALDEAGQEEAALMVALRRLRQQEMLRICWRDLAGFADVVQTLRELSDFAEAVVTATVDRLHQQLTETLGVPKNSEGEEQRLLVLAMGKLGGRELNFSSDIDLIFAYADDGETEGGRRLSNHEFFLRLARQLVKLLDEITGDGFVFRVDTRLRPYGDSGPLVMNFNALEQYYQLQGRNWERYAMIKARILGGNESDRRYLRSMLRPFVYRRYLDFGAFESIREMKGMIEAEVRRKGLKGNIKLGSGGIREIEFIGQTFQLIRGGRERGLQIRGILEVLTLLVTHGYLESVEAGQLHQAYLFLRRLENRLQMERDMQTHSLPTEALSRERIRLALGFSDWDELLQILNTHRDAVRHVFDAVIAGEQSTDDSELRLLQLYWDDQAHSENFRQWLKQHGFAEPDDILEVLKPFIRSARIRVLSADTLRMVQQLLIGLLVRIGGHDVHAVLLRRTLDIIQAVVGRPVYISLLLEYPGAQTQMLTLCAASQWFADEIARYPILLDELLNSEELFRQDDRERLAVELERLMSHIDADDLEQQMDSLRQFRRTAAFKLAATDMIDAHAIEDVGSKLSAIAEVVLDKVFELGWSAISARHGVPMCTIDGMVYRPGMAIIGYGKLGGKELGYGSDLDIIFLHDSAGERQVTDGELSIDNSQFFARVAQKILHILGTRMHSGLLYEADTRLRPDGNAGLLVSGVAGFEDYQRNKAWTWEHQALLRARAISGSEPVRREFDRIRQSVLALVREPGKVLADVAEMREKMRAHLGSKQGDEINIKQDEGGMVDIEFITHAGLLLNAYAYPELLESTSTIEFLPMLVNTGWFGADEAEDLAVAYRAFRQLANRQALQVELPEGISSLMQPHRDRVSAIWNRLIVSGISKT